MYDATARISRARRAINILRDYLQSQSLKNLTALDIGSSTGIIDSYLSGFFKKFTGIDIDRKGIEFAQKKFQADNLCFRFMNAQKTKFADNSFDVVFCMQIYEHVSNSRKLFSEIYRILKPGGVCFLSAVNKFWPIEPHQNLLFLSFLSPKYAKRYSKLFGHKDYPEKLLSYWQLKEQLRKFKIIEYTNKIFLKPEIFFEKPRPFYKILGIWPLKNLVKYFPPTFFWLLVKA